MYIRHYLIYLQSPTKLISSSCCDTLLRSFDDDELCCVVDNGRGGCASRVLAGPDKRRPMTEVLFTLKFKQNKNDLNKVRTYDNMKT